MKCHLLVHEGLLQMSKAKTVDLTSGPILKTLAELALPIMISSMLGTAYSIMDMAWIGLLGAKAVAGVGVGGMYVWLSQLKMNIVDNKLLMIDKYEGKQITMIDLINTNKIERIANIGEGPNEFLNLRDITYNSKNNSLAFFDGMLRQVSFYKINEHKIQINNNTFHRKVRFNADCPYDIVAFGDYFLANGCFNAKQFALLNSKADIIAEFGVFPGDNTGVEVENSFFLKNQTTLCTNLDQSRFVAAGYFHDQLVFYRFENNKIIKVREYFSMNAKMVSRHTKDGNQDIYSSSENDETTRTYRMLYSTKEHIYALYWGIANKDFGKTGKVCYILKFDWNGNLKEGFKVNNLLKNIAIDEISNCIYAVTYPEDERESILMKYEM